MAFCNQCGKQLNEGAKFCGNCGTKIFIGHGEEEAKSNNAPNFDSKAVF